jgi:hypothetical protein
MEYSLSSGQVAALVEQEMRSITNPSVIEQLKRWLVTPRKSSRDWDYGEPGTKYDCWIVLEHRDSNTAVAYCERGFGPKKPWGLLFIQGQYQSMGMDSGWFPHLEEAFLDSWACEKTTPAQ